MTIGLVLLALVAILIFFGVSERFFRSLGISNWLAFILVLALVIGAIVPNITIGGVFSLNVGGFLVPLVIMTVLMIIMRFGGELLRTVLSVLAVAAVAVAVRMLIEPANGGLILASSLIVGFAGGMAAFLVGQSRLATLAAAMGGIILGDIVVNFLYTFALGGYTFTLGSYGVFDSIIIASVFGILIYEAVAAIKRTAEKRTTGKRRTITDGIGTAKATRAVEAAQDDGLSLDEAKELSGDLMTEAGEDNDYELLGAGEAADEDIDSFFDDYV